MQFFYDIEKESAEGPNLIYIAAHVASYVEPTELSALHRDAANPAWADRIEAIRSIPFAQLPTAANFIWLAATMAATLFLQNYFCSRGSRLGGHR